MVHGSLFYSTDVEIQDGKRELWRKSKILEGSRSSKFKIEVQNWTFEGCFEVKMIFENIGEQTILITLDPGNTGKPSILITPNPGNTENNPF